MPLSGHFSFPRIDGAEREPPWTAADGVDAEELRSLYQQHGVDVLHRLRGPFAVAVWDGETLLLARDGFGHKPLFYAEKGGELWFGPDPQALKSRGAALGQIDRDALSDYLELLYVPSPSSIWSGVRKLPAGHLLRAGAQGVEVRRWFDLPAPGSTETRPSRIAVRAALEDAVRHAGAAPLWLTGELPSAALLALMTRAYGKVRTYAAESDPLARRVADRFRSDHHELRLQPLDEVPRALGGGEPLGDPRLVVQAAALRAISTGVNTAEGGDELFGGHPRYLRAARMIQSDRAARAADLLRSIAPRRHRGRLQRAASALASRGPGRARALVEIFSMDERKALLGSHARSAEGATDAAADGADQSLAFDLEVAVPDGSLPLLRAAALCAGVEARAPLLDAKLARAVVPAAARHKLGRTHGNRLLRDAVADLLPRDALTPEPPAPPPVGAWLRGPLRPMLEDLVKPPTARIRALLDPRAIDEVLRHSLAPRGDARQAWALLALELWARGR